MASPLVERVCTASSGRLLRRLGTLVRRGGAGDAAHVERREEGFATKTRPDEPGVSPRKWLGPKHVAALAALGCLCCLVYSNSLRGDFVFDDDRAILENPFVNTNLPPPRDLAQEQEQRGEAEHCSIAAVFRYDFWGHRRLDHPRSHKSYRPLTTLSFRMNFFAVGAEDTFWWHVVNVVLHGCCCIVLYAVAGPLYHGDAFAAFISAALFATQSVHVEAVSNVVSRCEVLAALLLLLTVASVQRCLGARSMVRFAAQLLVTLLLGVASLLAKEQGISALAIASAYAAFSALECAIMARKAAFSAPSPALTKASIKESWPYLMRSLAVACTTAAAFFACAVARWHLSGAPCKDCFPREINPAAFHESLKTRTLTMAYLWSMDLWLILCPVWLCCDWGSHSVPLVHSVQDTRMLSVVGAALFCLLPIASFLSRMRICLGRDMSHARSSYAFVADGNLRGIGVAMAVLLLSFLPASGAFVRVGFVIAERTLYMPSIGICLLYGLGIHRLRGESKTTRIGHYFLYFCAFLAIASQGARTLQRNIAWHDSPSLFISGIYEHPTNARLHTFAGRSLIDNDAQRAEGHFRKSLQYGRDAGIDEQSYNDLGRALAFQGRYEEALAQFQESVRIKPGYSDGTNNIAFCIKRLRQQGRLDGDRSTFDNEVDVANLHARGQQYGLAIQHYEAALASRLPSDSKPGAVMNNLAMVYGKVGRVADAERILREALTADPDFGGNIPNLARLLRDLNREQEAVEVERSSFLAHGQEPSSQDGTVENESESEASLISKLQKDSSNAEHWYSLGRVMLQEEVSRVLDAEQCFRMALNKDPTHVQARRTLESMLHLDGG